MKGEYSQPKLITHRYEIAQHVDQQYAQSDGDGCDDRNAATQRWMRNFGWIDGGRWAW